MSNPEIVRQINADSLPYLEKLDWNDFVPVRKVGTYGEYTAAYSLHFTTLSGNRCILEMRPKDELLGLFLALHVGTEFPIKLSFTRSDKGKIIINKRIDG